MSIKQLKRGEFLFRENDKISSLFLIQSGGISLTLTRGKKNIDLFQLGASQILGESVLLGQTHYSTSAVATSECKVMEIPLEQMKALYESSPQTIKVILKSLGERLRQATSDIKSNKLEKDTLPCPEESTAQSFAAVYFTLMQKGESLNNNKVEIEWSVFKNYSQRLFALSPKKAEEILNIFVKLGVAQLFREPPIDNPEGPPELNRAQFHNVQMLEGFFEYFQYFYFKSGKTDILKVDDFCLEMTEGLLNISKDIAADRTGVVTVEFHKFSEFCKNQMHINLNSDHFVRLEQKGIFIKRISRSSGVHLDFDRQELQTYLNNWKILREIEKWNEKGLVDLNDKDVKWSEKNKPQATLAEGMIHCPSCSTPMVSTAKFCSECGHKIAQAA